MLFAAVTIAGIPQSKWLSDWIGKFQGLTCANYVILTSYSKCGVYYGKRQYLSAESVCWQFVISFGVRNNSTLSPTNSPLDFTPKATAKDKRYASNYTATYTFEHIWMNNRRDITLSNVQTKMEWNKTSQSYALVKP